MKSTYFYLVSLVVLLVCCRVILTRPEAVGHGRQFEEMCRQCQEQLESDQRIYALDREANAYWACESIWGAHAKLPPAVPGKPIEIANLLWLAAGHSGPPISEGERSEALSLLCSRIQGASQRKVFLPPGNDLRTDMPPLNSEGVVEGTRAVIYRNLPDRVNSCLDCEDLGYLLGRPASLLSFVTGYRVQSLAQGVLTGLLLRGLEHRMLLEHQGHRDSSDSDKYELSAELLETVVRRLKANQMPEEWLTNSVVCELVRGRHRGKSWQKFDKQLFLWWEFLRGLRPSAPDEDLMLTQEDPTRCLRVAPTVMPRLSLGVGQFLISAVLPGNPYLNALRADDADPGATYRSMMPELSQLSSQFYVIRAHHEALRIIACLHLFHLKNNHFPNNLEELRDFGWNEPPPGSGLSKFQYSLEDRRPRLSLPVSPYINMHLGPMPTPEFPIHNGAIDYLNYPEPMTR